MLLLLPEKASVAIRLAVWGEGTMHKTTHDGDKDSETSLELQQSRGVPIWGALTQEPASPRTETVHHWQGRHSERRSSRGYSPSGSGLTPVLAALLGAVDKHQNEGFAIPHPARM